MKDPNDFFDEVQEEIKKIIEDKNKSDNDTQEQNNDNEEHAQKFNDSIFDQPQDTQEIIKDEIDSAAENNENAKDVAKRLVDRFGFQVQNNVFNQEDNQNVPNPMMGERKFIKTYEQFKNDNQI